MVLTCDRGRVWQIFPSISYAFKLYVVTCTSDHWPDLNKWYCFSVVFCKIKLRCANSEFTRHSSVIIRSNNGLSFTVLCITCVGLYAGGDDDFRGGDMPHRFPWCWVPSITGYRKKSSFTVSQPVSDLWNVVAIVSTVVDNNGLRRTVNVGYNEDERQTSILTESRIHDYIL